MSTGVKCSDEAVQEFTGFKKNSNATRYIVYKITNGEIVKEAESESKDFNEFLARLPENEGRYALYKMDFLTKDNREATKIVNIAWNPDNSPVKAKMLYAGSKDAFNRMADGISIKIAATDMAEITEDIMVEACKKFA